VLGLPGVRGARELVHDGLRGARVLLRALDEAGPECQSVDDQEDGADALGLSDGLGDQLRPWRLGQAPSRVSTRTGVPAGSLCASERGTLDHARA
jgi:hypothetical protein